MGQQAGMVDKTEEKVKVRWRPMDKPWMLVVAVILGLFGGLLMREHEPTTPVYHYEERVEIIAGFYTGHVGTVETCYTTIMGGDQYTIHLEKGGWAYDIAGTDLKLITLEELTRKK